MDYRAPKQHRSEAAPRGQPRAYDDGTPWSTDDYRQHRREHADQQKETSATVEYFTSVESALIAVSQQQQQLLQQQQNEAGTASADAAEGGNDDAATSAPAAALGPAMVLDGFCTELTKRLSRDATHLLSHRVVCRVLELALSAAEERHLQAITYALLGKLGKMCLSGAASFVVETLLASIYHVVGRPQQASDAAGNTEDSGGLPPLRELFGLVIDELVEATSALLWDRGGAKCLTAALLVSSGFPVRSVPSNDGFSDFAAVDKLVAALVPILDEPSTVGARNVFADCCVHVSACFVIQALIKASHAHPTNGELKEFVSVNLAPITAQLMQDTVGTRVVECYASTGDDQAWGLVLKLATEAVRAGGTFVPEFAILSLIDGINTVGKAEQLWKEIFAFDDSTLLAWVRLRNGIPAEKQTKPHPLTRFVARIGAPADAELGIAPVATGKKPSARKADRGKDEEEEAWRSELPTEFRRDFCNAVARATRTVCPKGPAHALLVEHIGGTPAGANLLAELLALGRVAASTVVHSVDKIRMEDLPAVAMTPGGSLCLQRYVDAVGPESATQVLDVVDKIAEAKARAEAAAAEAAAKPLTGALLRLAFKARDKSTDVTDKLKPRIPLPPKPQPKTATPAPAAASTPAAPAPTASALLKLTRRLLPSIVTLSKDKYASFLLQHIYLHGALDVRAGLCQALADHHGELKLDFIASKLMVHCCVEQYLYRRDEWRAQATRQTHVRKVMAAVIAAEIAHAKKQQTAGAEDTSAAADNGAEAAASNAGGAKNNSNRGRPGTAGGAKPNQRPKRERSAAPPTTAAKPAQGRATTAPTTTD